MMINFAKLLLVQIIIPITAIYGYTSREREPTSIEFCDSNVLVRVTIHSNIYTYEVNNLSDSPLTSFKIKQHAAYNFQAPANWEMDTNSNYFYAWTNNDLAKIYKNQTANFSMRVSSQGAVLGSQPLELKSESGRMFIISNVWTPVKEPKSYLILIVFVTIGIMLSQTFIVSLRNKNHP